MSYEVRTIANFDKALKQLLKKHASILDDLELLVDDLVINPVQGTSLGKGCYKIRLAIKSKGKGKSGGARVITLVRIIQEKVYLLTIYDKSEKVNISDQELKDILDSI